MSERRRRYPYAIPIAIGAGLIFPTLSLVPLGSVWLWNNGYLLYWALISAGFIAMSYLVQARILRAGSDRRQVGTSADLQDETVPADPTWTPAEEAAWADVLTVARGVDIQTLNSQDAFIALGTKTIRAVAKRLHPEVTDPLWQFTVPEAFAIVEQVSRRLGDFTVASIPLSDRLTVAQVLSVYRWRGAIGMAEKVYDMWRLVRLVNPLAAATHELREKLSKQMMQWGTEHVTKRLADAYVTEVGRAAIDLYGGRLSIRPSAKGPGEKDTDGARVSSPEPIRILIAGQTGAGKSSLLNALRSEMHAAVDILPTTEEFVAYELQTSDFPTAQIVDSPGLTTSEASSARLTEQAMRCDLLIWVAQANRADREVDRKTLGAIRGAFAARVNRRQPAMLLIATNIDKLRPFNEWLPPYDLAAAERPKARSIRDATEQLGGELGFTQDAVVPVNLASVPPYNIDAVWARIVQALPDAQSAQLVRHLRDGASGRDWKRVLSQAATAGRVLGRTFIAKQK